jgi:serine/threonine protein kinase
MAKVALVVGINDYPSAPLQYCVPDATEIAEVLQENEYGFHVEELHDGEATRLEIKRRLNDLGTRAPEQLLFYFAGHGVWTDLGTYLVTVDGQPLDEGIEVEELSRLLQRFHTLGTSTILVLDCCHSGNAAPWRNYGRPLTHYDLEGSLPHIASDQVVLAACRPEQYSYEDDTEGHGLFTKHLLAGLHGYAADRDGNVTAHSLYEYVLEPFKSVTNQSPVLREDISTSVVLGTGFAPLTAKPVTQEYREQLTAQAHSYLDSYRMRDAVPHQTWLVRGYNDSCRALQPILRWFEKTLQEHPDLAHHRDFRELHEAALAQLTGLGSATTNTHVSDGILAEHLGSGAFGVVWRVDSSTGQRGTKAYKIYHPQDLHLGGKLERFHRGFRAMQQLDHPRIVRVHNFTNCPVGFFMDYIEGPNLRDFSPNTNPDLDTVDLLELLLTAAETIRFAHYQADNSDRRVIHRDIKPENIIVHYRSSDGAWVPYLTDFDLAWFATATALTKTAMGNPYYAAPEQLERPNSAAARDAAVDSFSFGQLLFFVVVGDDPVTLGRDSNLRRLQTAIEAWGSSEAASKVLELYQKCTAFSPENRPAFPAIADELSAVITDLKAYSAGGRLDLPRLLTEIAFTLIGLNASQENDESISFLTLSGRSRVTLRARQSGRASEDSVDLEAHLVPQGGLLLAAETNEDARRALNRRIDLALRGQNDVQRRSGRQGTYEVFIDLRNVPLNPQGVIHCRSILGRSVEALERI